MAPSRERQGKRIFWVHRQCLVEKVERLGALFILKHPDVRHRAHGVVVCAQILRSLAPRALDFGYANGGLQRARHLLRYAILKVENIVESAVVVRGPDMCATLGLDELDCHPEAVAGLLYAAF